MKALIWLLASLAASNPAIGAESTCFGAVGNGRLQNGEALPSQGKNFAVYSSVAAGIGRNYVHSKVAEIVLSSYAALEKSAPEKTFVYGETGWASGGRFRPHRTHQNGLSVDFMVPVIEPSGRSVPLPGTVLNRFGYDLEFDSTGRYNNYTIDFSAVGEHLYQLHIAARARRSDIALVIFDPPFLPLLFSTLRGAHLKQSVKFLAGKAWWRHDEHYHVDFAVPCKPLT